MFHRSHYPGSESIFQGLLSKGEKAEIHQGGMTEARKILLTVIEKISKVVLEVRHMSQNGKEEKGPPPHIGVVSFEKRKYPRFNIDLPVEYYRIDSPV
ncbi:MAG: hypothetical protein HXY44_04665, partial [Syntrophaceae bacterium]|nr:hypothetical protein [Syntrophaceae bacterium]